MQPKSSSIVTPEPYFNIVFGCGNRAFYEVKNELYEIGESVGIEAQDGYMEEKCDYEGDLEEIIIYRGERDEAFCHAVLKYYNIDPTTVPDDMNISLSIH